MEKLTVKKLYDLDHTIAKSLFETITYPWEALSKIKDYILELGATLDESKFDKIGDDIWVAKNATIAPSASLNGPLIIDEEAEVRHCAFIRGSAIVGKNAVVGNSTELKNCILFDNVQVPHYNYVGDSIYGYKSHTGAGVIASNLKSDKSLVTLFPSLRIAVSPVLSNPYTQARDMLSQKLLRSESTDVSGLFVPLPDPVLVLPPDDASPAIILFPCLSK